MFCLGFISELLPGNHKLQESWSPDLYSKFMPPEYERRLSTIPAPFSVNFLSYTDGEKEYALTLTLYIQLLSFCVARRAQIDPRPSHSPDC
jgi:hypothetical protein